MVGFSGTSGLMAAVRLAAWGILCIGGSLLLLRNHKQAHAVEAVERPALTREQPLEANVCAAMDALDVQGAIDRLRSTRPEYVGIGNSMLFTRLGRTQAEVEQFNKLTGHNFCFILRGGSASAAWYLTLKNVVAASGVRPRMVFFFFRDTELTSPNANTTGKFAGYLNSLRGASEPVLDRLLQLAPVNEGWFDGTVNRTAWWLTGPGGVFNYSSQADKIQQRLTRIAMQAGGGRILKTKGQKVLTDRFALDRLRPDLAADMAWPDDGNNDPNATFSTQFFNQEQASFLPAMMDVARENGIKLLFFRVKRRPEADGGVTASEPDQMRGYVKRLQHWIEERGGLLYDETYDPNIRLEAYNDGDHIGEGHRDWYRKYFWQRVAPMFP